jgi:hypothetical protein
MLKFLVGFVGGTVVGLGLFAILYVIGRIVNLCGG